MADSSSPQSTYRRGKEYYDAKQYARAFEAFQEAAAAGCAAATTRLGFMYRYGIAVQKDISRATEFFERGIAQGHPHAKGLLGNLLIHGTSGYFLGGIAHPRQVMRGIGLIISGIRDALRSGKPTTW
jgi:TPR repeat protein